jgi:hypothetical protein
MSGPGCVGPPGFPGNKGDVIVDHRANQIKDEPAVKYDSHKNRYDLLPPEALDDIVKIYTYGAIKYPSPRNWENGMSWGRVFGAMMRHAWAFWRGEDMDPESKLPHLAHAAWCCLTLLQYMRTHREMDDRSTAMYTNKSKEQVING